MQSAWGAGGGWSVAPRYAGIYLRADLHLPDIQRLHANARRLATGDHQASHFAFDKPARQRLHGLFHQGTRLVDAQLGVRRRDFVRLRSRVNQQR